MILVYHQASDGPFGPFWDPSPFAIMSDYETLLFLEKQEAFWKSRKLSGKGRKLSGKAGSFLVYHEASDGPFGPFGTLGPKKVSQNWDLFRPTLFEKVDLP